MMAYHSDRRADHFQEKLFSMITTHSQKLDGLLERSSPPTLAPPLGLAPGVQQDVDSEEMAIHVGGYYMHPLHPNCGSFCRCACHTTRNIRMPKKIQRALGSLFVGYTSIPIITPRCDDPQCSRTSGSSATVSFLFPQWFWSRRLFASVAFLRDSSPQLILRLSHVRPNNAEIFLMAFQGDTNGIRGLLRSGKASPYDCDTTGLTPLHVSEQSPQKK